MAKIAGQAAGSTVEGDGISEENNSYGGHLLVPFVPNSSDPLVYHPDRRIEEVAQAAAYAAANAASAASP